MVGLFWKPEPVMVMTVAKSVCPVVESSGFRVYGLWFLSIVSWFRVHGCWLTVEG